MSLEEYRDKRKFDKTPEPYGDEEGSSIAPRFFIQKHDASHLHFDLRLEAAGVLKSWAVPKGPPNDDGDKRLAVMVEDHPLNYGSFEGIIPQGNYGAGTVMVWDKGTYEVPGSSSAKDSRRRVIEGIGKGHFSLIFHGRKINGEFALARQGQTEEKKEWLFVKKENGKRTDAEKSVQSGLTMEEIKEQAEVQGQFWISEKKELDLGDFPKAPFPKIFSPMLAVLGERPFSRSGWIFEVKWDGYRIMAQIQDGKVALYSRNKNDMTGIYSPVANTLAGLGHDALIDGEVVVVDETGKPDFQQLQDYQKDRGGNLLYCVFDLLYLDGHDLTSAPLQKRKQILREILTDNRYVRFSEHISEEGEEFFKIIQAEGLEGMVAKDGSSKYVFKRSSSWIKIKTQNRQEVVIAGFTEPRGSRRHLGALILGVYEGEKLVYAGHTSGGGKEVDLAALRAKLAPLEVSLSPFENPPKVNSPAHWLRPEIVAEVRFREWTKEGVMRQSTLVGLRNDIRPENVKREKRESATDEGSNEEASAEVVISNHRQKITNLGKIFWPEDRISKGELIEYYSEVAETIVPYLKNRPQSLKRYPNGIYGESFFQKNINFALPRWVETIKIKSDHEDREINYFLCQNKESLIFLANLGCIDLNPWNSQANNLDYPDYLVIDLDPEDIDFAEVLKTALAVKSVLERAGVVGYPKTSGATGLHIYIPTEGKYHYDQVKEFAKIVALLSNTVVPDKTSLERSPKDRQKKVYIDYLQNARGQTLAAPYSVRPVPGAQVSAPLTWAEVKSGIRPADFTIKNMPHRIMQKGDLFRPVLAGGVDLGAALQKLSG